MISLPRTLRFRELHTAALAFAVFLVAQLMALFSSGLAGLPPRPSDAVNYDSIAVQLLKGHGFADDYLDPEWRRPYEADNATGAHRSTLALRRGLQPTTYRPPLLPVMLAGVYAVFGRSFLAWQILSCVMTAAALATMCVVALRTAGVHVMAVTAALLFMSRTYPTYTSERSLLTEPVALFAMSLLAFALSSVPTRPRLGAVASGVALAGLGLSRSLYVPWALAVPVLVWWLARRTSARAVRIALVTLTIAVAVQMPWWIRNCLVLGRFMPFGTQGGANMYAGYSDLALQHRGVWWPATDAETGCPGCDEVTSAVTGTKRGMAWIAENPLEVVFLFRAKATDALRSAPEAGTVGYLFGLALFAPFVVWRRRAAMAPETALALAMLVLLNVGTIAATWSDGWRYLVPVEPLIASFAGIAIVALIFGDGAWGSHELPQPPLETEERPDQ